MNPQSRTKQLLLTQAQHKRRDHSSSSLKPRRKAETIQCLDDDVLSRIFSYAPGTSLSLGSLICRRWRAHLRDSETVHIALVQRWFPQINEHDYTQGSKRLLHEVLTGRCGCCGHRAFANHAELRGTPEGKDAIENCLRVMWRLTKQACPAGGVASHATGRVRALRRATTSSLAVHQPLRFSAQGRRHTCRT